jgi:Flp pilus assembly protein TadD
VSHETHERADVERRRIDDEIIRDLERLLASVRWVQREEFATRRSHAAQLPPVPERPVPPAMSSRSDNLRGPLLVLIVSIFAVLSALYFWVEGGGPSSKHSTGERMATVESKSITSLPPSSSSQEDSRTNIDQDYALAEVTTEPPELSQRADSSTVAMLRRDSLTTQAPLSGTHVRLLDPEGIKLLMKQGEEFMAAGDVVTARMVFQRAAEAGDANAAIAVGATYDPEFFAKLGVVGISADTAQARSWYEKAGRLGSPEAKRLLDLLANR